MHSLEVCRHFSFAPEVVWRRYTDHLSYSRWAGLGRAALFREGSPDRNGVGCVRTFTTLGFAVYEEVVAFEPPRYMAYRLIRGAVPMRDHLGEATIESAGDGTLLTWRCRFESTLPLIGGLSRAGIEFLFRRALDGLERDLQGQRG